MDYINEIPDFPEKGILFYDISPLFNEPSVFKAVIEELKIKIELWRPDALVGVESRGFLFAIPLALQMNIPFSMIRKKGKLPGKIISEEYDLEYGTDIIEIKSNAFLSGERVVIIDDLLATGGTAAACTRLLEKAGCEIAGLAFFIELHKLNGREALDKYLIETIMKLD
tara:strand:- start:4921 stop:5427 length:507 start_codon:yes stop_codon:yes gene_type:complete